MIGRKAVVGISLLCALAFCAFGAANASAAGTTAFTCVRGGTEDYEDAHCDHKNGIGPFGHEAIPAGTTTNIVAKNDLTGTPSSFLLAGKIAGTVIHITCAEASGTGTIKNNAGPPMTISFGESTTKFTTCKVTTPTAAEVCTVAVEETHAVETDPMTLGLGAEKELPTGPATNKTKVYEEGKGTEMGLKFSPNGGGVFTNIILGGAGCPAGVTGKFKVEGSAYAIGGAGGAAEGSGATAVFSPASTLGSLKFANNPAFLEGTLTFSMEGTGGNPVTITTTAT